MYRALVQDGAQQYSRISKNQARKMFNAGKNFYIIAHKMRPGFPFFMGMNIDSVRIKVERSCTSTYPTVKSLFDATITEFCLYNANCYETGYYAAFYIVTDINEYLP